MGAHSVPLHCAIQQGEAKDLVSAVRAGIPLVIRNHPQVRRLADTTSLSSLAKRLSGREIEVENRRRWIPTKRSIAAGAYLSNISGTEYYWRHFLLQSFGLKVELPKPASRRSTYFDYGWIGPSDTIQTFHQDNHDDMFVNHNIFAQVIGQKYVAVASPADSSLFQSLPLSPGDNRHSSALPWDPSTRQACKSLGEATLDAGDILYIPPKYWHFMRSNSVSMSVSRWWFDSRIAEIIYGAAIGIDLPRVTPSAGADWEADLNQFGCIQALNELLKKKPTMIQLQITIALTSYYGKGILNAQG